MISTKYRQTLLQQNCQQEEQVSIFSFISKALHIKILLCSRNLKSLKHFYIIQQFKHFIVKDTTLKPFALGRRDTFFHSKGINCSGMAFSARNQQEKKKLMTYSFSSSFSALLPITLSPFKKQPQKLHSEKKQNS